MRLEIIAVDPEPKGYSKNENRELEEWILNPKT